MKQIEPNNMHTDVLMDSKLFVLFLCNYELVDSTEECASVFFLSTSTLILFGDPISVFMYNDQTSLLMLFLQTLLV
ncbi:hypothetical protein HanRHA438_Chr05g0210141 [Helianthus annuus]|nr:hypothetical protein HanIR_Chr05g0216221 [Helianthus annuus]KAJ0917794.1 hypothetical protein HanRHA438_Chr05g0210141 [Helianthus annuus]